MDKTLPTASVWIPALSQHLLMYPSASITNIAPKVAEQKWLLGSNFETRRWSISGFAKKPCSSAAYAPLEMVCWEVLAVDVLPSRCPKCADDLATETMGRSFRCEAPPGLLCEVAAKSSTRAR
jgi:hypothetical protein